MNLFDNILKSQFNNFTGQAQSQVPSFGTPQSPRTMNYTQPTTTSAKTAPVVRNSGFAPGFEGTVDQTQSPVFKAVQSGANLFTGIKKRLGETVQEDESRATVEKDKKQKEMVTAMLQEGFGEEAITKAFEKLKNQGQFDYNPNLSARLLGGTANRMEKMQSETERLASEGLDVFSSKVPLKQFAGAVSGYAGQVPATVFDPIASAISPVVQNIIEKTGQTENIQSLATEYEDMAKQYPNLAFGLEGLFNVGSLAPIPKIGGLVKSGTDATKNALKVVAPKAIDMVTPNLGKTSRKLIASSDEAFRKQAEDIAVPKLSEMGFRDKQKVAGDVVETKPGFFKKEELVRSPQEALAIEEVSRMLKEGKIKKGGTELQKSVAISDEITGLAEALKGRLDNSPNQVNLPKSEVESFIDGLAKKVEKNAFIVGDTRESANKIIQNIKDGLKKDTYTANDLLEIRKQLDSDIREFKGETVFDPKVENAFSTTLREFRQGLNNKVTELVPDADVRNFLDRQSALYTARDNVDLKWSKQANSTIGRVLSKIQSVTGIPRTEIIELTTALGLLGASSLAPIVAPIAIGATAIAGGKKAIQAILSPKNKAKLANVLSKLDEAIKKNPTDSELLKAKDLFSKYNKNGGTTTNILRPSNNGLSNSQSVKKPIVKPNTIKNESKVSKPTTSDTIPEGYTKNAFGEIIKKPSNKKGGFIRLGSEPKKLSNPLVEEARKLAKEVKIKEKKAYEIADRTLSKFGIKTKDIKIVGSRAKGTEKPTSDIDIIITPDENIKKIIPDFPVKWNESEIQLNRKLRLEIEKNLEELFGKDISLDVNLGFAKKMPGEDKVYAISLSEFLKKKLK